MNNLNLNKNKYELVKKERLTEKAPLLKERRRIKKRKKIGSKIKTIIKNHLLEEIEEFKKEDKIGKIEIICTVIGLIFILLFITTGITFVILKINLPVAKKMVEGFCFWGMFFFSIAGLILGIKTIRDKYFEHSPMYGRIIKYEGFEAIILGIIFVIVCAIIFFPTTYHIIIWIYQIITS